MNTDGSITQRFVFPFIVFISSKLENICKTIEQFHTEASPSLQPSNLKPKAHKSVETDSYHWTFIFFDVVSMQIKKKGKCLMPHDLSCTTLANFRLLIMTKTV